MFGRKKKKYNRHVTVRLAVGILITLFLVQLIAFGANSIGILTTLIVGDGSNVSNIDSFIREKIDAGVFEEALRNKEKPDLMEKQEAALNGYAYALKSMVNRIVIACEADDGYYVLSDISPIGGSGQGFLEKLEGLEPGSLDDILDRSDASGEEQDGLVKTLNLMDSKTGVIADKLIRSSPGQNNLSSMILVPGVISETADGDRIIYFLLFDPTGISDYSIIGILMVAAETIVSTLLIVSVLVVWINRRVASPLKKIRNSAVDFISQTKGSKEPDDWNYQAPKIKTRDEIQELGDSVENMANEIKWSVKQILAAAKDKERVGIELELAAGIQKSMLPGTFPAFPDRKDFDIYASMDPAREVGGDFYDFFLVDETHLYMVIADVSGKGIPASLFMMSSQLIINSFARAGNSPAEILAKANDRIEDNNRQNMFVTAWVGILDLETGILKAANAGHEYPAVRTASEGFALLKDKHGFVLGEMDGMKYREYEIALEPGDAVFVYTDGVAEANNEAQEMFGTKRVIDVLNTVRDSAPKEILTAMTAAVTRHMGKAEQFDDATMLCVKYLGRESCPTETEDASAGAAE